MTEIIEIASDRFVCFDAEHMLKMGKIGKGERTGGIKAFVPHNVRVIKNASTYTWNTSVVRDRNTIPLKQLQQFCWGYFFQAEQPESSPVQLFLLELMPRQSRSLMAGAGWLKISKEETAAP